MTVTEMFLNCSHHEGDSDGSLVDNQLDCSVGKKANLQWKAEHNVYY